MGFDWIVDRALARALIRLARAAGVLVVCVAWIVIFAAPAPSFARSSDLPVPASGF